jgi:hypothetical protein
VGAKDLPLASGAEHVKAFRRIRGCRIERGGTHVIVSRTGYDAHVSIPQHREVSRPLLLKQLRLLGIDESVYVDAFKKKGRFRRR